jgi:uncharacterized protein (TIGR03435 family)
LRFDIEAKLPTGAVSSSVNEMLQVLLEDRFALRTHHETRDVSGFSLVVGKDGPRLTQAVQASTPPIADEVMRKLDRLADQQRSASVAMWYQNDATAAEIAEDVFRTIRTPVVDRTSLAGKYDVSLNLPPPESLTIPWSSASGSP